MNIQKASEILSDNCRTHHVLTDPDFMDAIQLGREALKEIYALRQTVLYRKWRPLPEETED